MMDATRELVLASAGAGKTYRITSRLIGLLAAGAAAEQVFASTFTRKAAGQILTRTLERVARAAQDDQAARRLADDAIFDPDQAARFGRKDWLALLLQVVRSMHRVDVGTLDSYLVRAAASFESELSLAPGWRIAELTDEAEMASLALTRLLRDSPRAEILRLVALAARGEPGRSVHERLSDTMAELLGLREQLAGDNSAAWLVFRALAGANESTDANPCEIAARLEAVELPRTQGGHKIHSSWARAVPELITALREGEWQRAVDTTICQNYLAGNAAFAGVPFPPAFEGAMSDFVAGARGALRRELGEQVEALGQLSDFYRASYRAVQREAGAYGFEDITRLVGSGDPLGARSDLYYRLDGQTRHILLDEFQDTSLSQWRALEPLVDEIVSDANRAAIVVADPKQSIYGWRGAAPTLVHAVGDRYRLGDAHLFQSWRSSQVVLDVVNEVFRGIADNAALEGDPVRGRVARTWVEDFREHRAVHSLPGHVTVEFGPDDEGGGFDRPELCAYAADRIARIRASAPRFSIGVLTRTNRTVARIFLELKERGVPVSQEGGNPLSDSAACEAVLALLRLADHTGDTVAAYLIANSPLGEIVQLRGHSGMGARRFVSRRTRARLAEDGYGRTLASLARRLAPYCDAREARRLSQLAELGFQYDSGAGLRPSAFVRLAESTRTEDPAAADVRIMTIHQAKGLEFDIVVLPELSSPIDRMGLPPVLPYRQTATGPISAVFPAANERVRRLFPEIETAHEQARESVWRDELSGLYVALTRARYAVHAIVAPKAIPPNPKAVTPAAILWSALGDGYLPAQQSAGTVIYQAGSTDWASLPGAKPEHATDAATPPVLVEPSVTPDTAGRTLKRRSPSHLHSAGRVRVRDLLRIDSAEKLERGSLLHAWFEQVHWIEEGVPTDDVLLQVGHKAVPHLRPEVVRESLALFRERLARGAVRQALSRSRYEREVTVEREFPFVWRSDDMWMEGVIDRLVLTTEAGQITQAEILDFKTDRVEPQKLPDLIAQYRPQLEAYAQAVSRMYAIPPERCRTTLLFVELDRVEPVGSSEQSLQQVLFAT